MTARRLVAGAAIVALVIAAKVAPVHAGEDKKEEGWKRRVEAGVNLTDGNKDSVQTRAQIEAKRKDENRETELKFRGEVGESDGEQNRERVTAEATHRRELDPRRYIVYRVEFLYDGIAEVDYRIVASPSFGYYALRDCEQELRLEAGPAGVVEKKEGARDAYPALRLAEYYECRLTAVSKLLQGVEYVPELQYGSGSYLAKAFIELKADLDAQLALHVRLESDYDSQPADDKEKQDTSFSASISYTF